MMDNKKPIEKDAVDSTLVRKMGEKVADSPSGFRTVENIDPISGDKTRLRTKGGNAQATVEKQPVKPKTDGCPKPPFVEVGFKYAAVPGTDPARNPYTVTSGYRTWHGEPNPSLPISPTNPKKVKRFNFSSDGFFCIEARKPKRLTFKDANNKKVELLLAERPNDPDDLSNEENQNYTESGAGTFVNVAKARGSSQGTDAADFKYSEGRYKYREWYPPEWQDIGWALKFVPNSAIKFMTKRLRKIALLITRKGSDAVKTVEWIFCNKDTPAYTGTPDAPLCAENNLREKSFSGRSFYSPNGHLSEVVMRARYAGLQPPYSGGDEVKLTLRRPGSILMNIDPEWVIPESGSTTHPGANDSIDIQDFAAFGNPYHGLVWYNGSSYTFYKDSSKTDTIPITPAYLSPTTQRYYNFQNIANTTDEEHIIRRKLPDNTYSYEAFYKDAIMYFGSSLPASSSNAFARVTQDEVLYKDPAGTVWVIEVNVTPFVPYSNGLFLPAVATLMRKFGDLSTNFDWNNHGTGLGQTNLGMLGGASTVDFWPFMSENRYGRGLAVPGYRNTSDPGSYVMWAEGHLIPSPDGKKCLAVNRTGDWNAGIFNAGGRIVRGVMFTFSGTGAEEADPENGIALGQGITCVAEEYPVKNPWPKPPVMTHQVQSYSYACSIPNPAYPFYSSTECLSVQTNAGSITCGTAPDEHTLEYYDVETHKIESATAFDPYCHENHVDYDFFWKDGRPAAVSVRYVLEYVGSTGSTVGTYAPYAIRAHPYCQGDAPMVSYTYDAEQLRYFQYTEATWEYRIELLVDGELIHKIGIRVTRTGTGEIGLYQLPSPFTYGAGFLAAGDTLSNRWNSFSAQTLEGRPVPISVTSHGVSPNDYEIHWLDLVPMAKLIPKTGGGSKPAKGTKAYPDWQRAISHGTQYDDFALTLVYEGKTTANETAISDLPTKLVFRDSVLETTMASFLPVPIDATYEKYSPNGWAYNPRTKELILVPNGELAYFF